MEKQEGDPNQHRGLTNESKSGKQEEPPAANSKETSTSCSPPRQAPSLAESQPILSLPIRPVIPIKMPFPPSRPASKPTGKVSFFSNMDISSATSATEQDARLREAFRQAQETECVSFAFNQSQLLMVPDQVGELRNLKELNFSFNKLSSLPYSISQLVNLRNLNLSENHFTEFPPIIFQITQLVQLNMSGNQLRRLPLEIGCLTELTQLHLDSNFLTTLPTSIGKLQKLQILHLQKNQFTALPSTIGRLKNLISLYLQDNTLVSLPSEICQLGNLKTLFVHNNRLTSLPPSVGQLSQVWWMNVNNNCLNAFPSSLGRLSKTLSDFHYQTNPLKDIPEFLRTDPSGLLFFLERELPPDVTVSSLVLPFDLKTMVNSESYSDMRAIVSGIEIPLHRCILFARRGRYYVDKLFPEFYYDDFETETALKQTVVLDMNVSHFLDILEFIYSGNSQKMLANPTRFEDYIVHPEENCSYEQLSGDLKQLYNNPKFSDVEFSVENRIVYGHKTVICCRCSPMAAMFNNPFKESKQKVIQVQDIPYDVFMHVMEFIYTGNTKITGDNAVDLLVVANLYQLERLKEMCEKVIEGGVDDQNRVQLLQFSNTYHAMQLEEFCAHAFVKMKDKDYNKFTSSQEFFNLNEEIKLLIKRKRDGRMVSFSLFEGDRSSEDNKKNKSSEGTPNSQNGGSNETEGRFSQYQSRCGIMNTVFTYDGPLDFHFRPTSASTSSPFPSLSLISPTGPTGRSSVARRTRHRRKKSVSSGVDPESSAPTVQFGSFVFEAPHN
eukprot:TRINITY_DN6827_c0_g1_i1.p1 TRINITY_DN6827_c0_g1~~TRINITY_DN6827_c0_g1_i1.p1  ORF type:complete len:779 (-),score=221.16 TRINITY_DN6827_c0_g1_i1:92-2428(-)